MDFQQQPENPFQSGKCSIFQPEELYFSLVISDIAISSLYNNYHGF